MLEWRKYVVDSSCRHPKPSRAMSLEYLFKESTDGKIVPTLGLYDFVEGVATSLISDNTYSEPLFELVTESQWNALFKTFAYDWECGVDMQKSSVSIVVHPSNRSKWSPSICARTLNQKKSTLEENRRRFRHSTVYIRTIKKSDDPTAIAAKIQMQSQRASSRRRVRSKVKDSISCTFSDKVDKVRLIILGSILHRDCDPRQLKLYCSKSGREFADGLESLESTWAWRIHLSTKTNTKSSHSRLSRRPYPRSKGLQEAALGQTIFT